MMRPCMVLASISLGLSVAATSMAYEASMMPDQSTAAAETPLFADRYEGDLESGACWTSGNGHGYPTRMWVLVTDMLGSYYVDTAIQRRIDYVIGGGDIGGVMPHGESVTYTLVAFCDGIDLATGEPIKEV